MQLVQDSMDIIADNQRLQFEQYIGNKIDILQGLVLFPDIYEMDTMKQKRFIKNRSKALGFHHLFVMQKDGMAYYIEEDLCRNQRDEPFYDDVMDHDIYVTEPFYGTGQTIMTISVSIYDKEKQKVGALCGAVDLHEIQEVFQENKMFLNGRNYLINRAGNYVVAENMAKVHNQVSVYLQSNTDAFLIKKAFEERKDQKGTLLLEGIEYEANITYLDGFDWIIVQCVMREKIFDSLRYIDAWRYSSLFIMALIIFCVIRIVVYWRRSDKKINTDTLTGCNSRAAMQYILEYLNMTENYDVCVIYLDLNKFKYVNDTYGHDAGDKILRIFGETLMEVFGALGYVGRIGGDEFMVILLDKKEEEILALCQLVQESLAKKSNILDFAYTIETSYGYAIRRRGSMEDIDDIVAKADERMYGYKENHKNIS